MTNKISIGISFILTLSLAKGQDLKVHHHYNGPDNWTYGLYTHVDAPVVAPSYDIARVYDESTGFVIKDDTIHVYNVLQKTRMIVWKRYLSVLEFDEQSSWTVIPTQKDCVLSVHGTIPYFGFYNPVLNISIPETFLEIQPFDSRDYSLRNYLLVKTWEGYYGIIDRKGKWIIEPIAVNPVSIHQNRCLIKTVDSQFFLYDINGEKFKIVGLPKNLIPWYPGYSDNKIILGEEAGGTPVYEYSLDGQLIKKHQLHWLSR